ncbi:recombinase RecA [Candidatus Mycoplasma haematominutum]|uniref:Protein RecA n=1 Tax=Candidatus Mycoplasma haematominutum 'Birmingham 1' TaxID=1116213 RepID=G8C3X5_9MOLU|nr:recombinase RecA [Candidatus Mycoplasma haematominutum]CCE67023.1 recombinase A [Candidatus Mycoplasma haematominutum 'Birmingham 1']
MKETANNGKTKNFLEKLTSMGVQLWTDKTQLQRIETARGSNAFHIPTGSYALDKSLGTGGWPSGKIIEIFGTDSSGKSTLALHAIAEAQMQGKTCVYIDLENTLNIPWAEKIGVKTDQLYISTPSSGEETFEIINSLIQSHETDLIVVDSVAAMVPEAELDASIHDQGMGMQARMMSKGLRILQSHLIKSNTAIIFINQVREQIRQTYVPTTTTSGGRALKYAASIRVEVKRQESIKQNDKIIGFLTKITIIKNKFNNPMTQVSLRLYFESGFDKICELINAAIEEKLIEKRGVWFYYKNKNLGQGLMNVKEKLLSEECKEDMEEIQTKVLNSTK